VRSFSWSTTAGLRHCIQDKSGLGWGHHQAQNTHQHQWRTAARRSAFQFRQAVRTGRGQRLHLPSNSSRINGKPRGLALVLGFLHGTIKEGNLMFMRQPPRSDESYRYPGKFYRVIRSLYGARQAHYIFTTKLDEKLIGWSYRRATADASAFYRLAPGNVNIVNLIITVDNFCSASNSEAYLEQCREQLESVYSVKDLGPVHSLICWRI
jgi:Reverse transcriptase (RNA-dependent DNA polymerase)